MDEHRSKIVVRMFVVYGFLMLLPLAIIIQMMRIQFIEGDNLMMLWRAQAVDEIPIKAKRGQIYDREGRLLVTNTYSYSVAVDPRAPGVKPEMLDETTEILAHFTNRTTSDYQRIIRQAPQGSRFISLGRNFGREVYDSLKSRRFRGVILEENFRRNYNFGELASHVLGHVNHEHTGVMGIENSYNRYLRGTDGVQQVRKDSRNRIKEFVGAPRRQPVQGNNLFTTIDAHIQVIVEEELKAGVERARAQKGTAIVVNPKTGAIVAMANYPTFNPNSPASSPTENRWNSAIADMVEPGSTFKLVTAVAAVDQNLVDFDEIFETPENGRRLIHGQWMRDHNPLGDLDFAQVMQRSSNVATAEIAQRIDPDVFYQYIRNFGFGSSTSIDLPGEETGRLRKPFEWSAVSLPWLSIGYEVQVTPLQMAMAYAAFANGGKLMRPYVIDRIEDERSRTVFRNEPKVIRQAANPEVINTLKPIFQGVVSDSGTAQWAHVDGLSIAGKTGTAQKFIDGRYRTRYRASFVGFFPVENPQYVAMLMFDEPRISIFGGFIAGPVFRNITTRLVGLDPSSLSIDQNLAEKKAPVIPNVNGMMLNQASALLQYQNAKFTVSGNGAYVVGQEPAPGEFLEEDTIIRLITDNKMLIGDGYKIVPDVVGMSMRDAIYLLKNAGFNVTRNGSGNVIAQFPESGAVMRQGRDISIRGGSRPFEQLLTSRGGH